MTTDCLILGGGLAGLWTAREIVRAGYSAVIVRDGRGASPWVHGFNRPVRPGDSARVFCEDTIKSGLGLSDPVLAEALCGDASVIFDEILEMGLHFNRNAEGDYQAIRPLGASYPRVVSIGNETGTAVMDRIWEEIGGKVFELPRARALELIKTDGRVTGAVVWDRDEKRFITVNARAVVLASGGFCGIYPVTTSKRDSGGDGCAMALNAGARLCDMEFIQFEPSAAVWPRELVGTSMITTLFFEGAVLRNRHGERFMTRYSPQAERVSKDMMARCIAAEIAGGNGTEHGGVYMDLTQVAREKLFTDYPMYVERYRSAGIDITTTWIELAPAAHTSLGGVMADADSYSGVTGLYVCGEMLGGLHGANRIGGSAGLETMVFGRRAGRSAARYLKSAPDVRETYAPVIPDGTERIADRLVEMRDIMSRTLERDVGVVRTAAGLEEAVSRLTELLEEAKLMRPVDADEAFGRMRLKNDLLTALALTLSALERKESLGCHTRADHPEPPERSYRVVVTLDELGYPKAERMDLDR